MVLVSPCRLRQFFPHFLVNCSRCPQSFLLFNVWERTGTIVLGAVLSESGDRRNTLDALLQQRSTIVVVTMLIRPREESVTTLVRELLITSDDLPRWRLRNLS